jgi:hypothetical protein
MCQLDELFGIALASDQGSQEGPSTQSLGTVRRAARHGTARGRKAAVTGMSMRRAGAVGCESAVPVFVARDRRHEVV